VSQILATRSIPENKKLLELIEQHAANTQCEAQIMVADHKYGTQALLKDAFAAHMVLVRARIQRLWFDEPKSKKIHFSGDKQRITNE